MTAISRTKKYPEGVPIRTGRLPIVISLPVFRSATPPYYSRLTSSDRAYYSCSTSLLPSELLSDRPGFPIPPLPISHSFDFRSSANWPRFLPIAQNPKVYGKGTENPCLQTILPHFYEGCGFFLGFPPLTRSPFTLGRFPLSASRLISEGESFRAFPP